MMGISSANAPALDLPARFMALSVASLTVFAVSAPWTLSLTQGVFTSFSLLALVHLVTLGFVGSMIIGASYQLVPVAIQVRLASVRFGRVSFWLYLPGLAFFLVGLTRTWLETLAVGAVLLGAAFLWYIGVILVTWWRSPDRDVVAWHIAIAVVHSAIGMIFGVLLAIDINTGLLGERVLPLLAVHIVMMLVGWVALTFTGVAYRLVGMFTLSDGYFLPWLAWMELWLVLGGTWLFALRFLFAWPGAFGQIGVGAMVAGFACFAAQIMRLFRKRMRRAIDIHVPFAFTSAFMAIMATVTLLAGLVAGSSPNDSVWVTATWLGLLGTAGTAIQGFFYKIATFLVWLKRYAPDAGRRHVPKLEELYSRRLAMAGWGLWTISIVLGASAILAGASVMPAIGVVLLTAVGCFVINVFFIARHWLRAEHVPRSELSVRPRLLKPGR